MLLVSNAVVECGFSIMRRIRSAWRCSLAEATLEHLMRITSEGPPLSAFDPGKAVAKFFSRARRPNVQPYNLKRKFPDPAYDSDSDYVPAPPCCDHVNLVSARVNHASSCTVNESVTV